MAQFQFNPPPGWPKPPAGWTPPQGWQPDPSWPAAPQGWNFWIDAGAASEPAPHPGAPSSNAPRKKLGRAAIIAIVTVSALVVGGGLFAINRGLAALTESFEASNGGAGTTANLTMEQALMLVQEGHDELQARVAKQEDGYDFRFYEERATEVLEEARALAQRPDDSTTPEVVAGYVDNLLFNQQSIDAEIAAWTEAFDPELTHDETNSSGTEAEAALDRISGGIATLEVNTVCDDGIFATGDAVACVLVPMEGSDAETNYWLDTTRVNVPERSLTEPRIDWDDTMLHEFAHVIQGKYNYRLRESPAWLTLFGENIELHADCMALAANSAYTPSYESACTPEMVAAAGQVWDGVTP